MVRRGSTVRVRQRAFSKEMRSGRRSSARSSTRAAASVTARLHRLLSPPARPKQPRLECRHLSADALDTAIRGGKTEAKWNRSRT